MSLIRKNFIYNNLFGITNVLVPLIIFPYISRVFGPEGVGKVSFAISLTSTFVIIGSLGIPVYGIREIAKSKANKTDLTTTFLEIVSIQFLWLLLTLSAYYAWIYFTDTFAGEYFIKIASFVHIVGIIGMINWFYQGIENYRFIALVNFGVKIFTICCLFILVHSPDEYWKYYGILVTASLLAFIASILNSLNYLDFKKKTSLNLKKHLSPIMILFSTQLAIGLYANVDIVLLNYFSSEEQVGFYTPAIRIVKISLIVITALGTVLIPKLSQYVKSGEIEKCKELLNKSIRFVLLISFPIMMFIFLFSNNIIDLFAGNNFQESKFLLKLLSPLVLFIGLNNIFGLQVLVPFSKEKKLFYAVSIGACVSFALNILLIPVLKSVGAAFTILITEFIITLITFYFSSKVISYSIPYKPFAIYLGLTLLFIPISMIFNSLFDNLLYVLITATSCVVIYSIGLLAFKDTFFKETILTHFKFRL